MTATYATVNGQILSENRGGTEKYYRPDTLGSVIAVTDSSGTVLSTRQYWPYGEVRVATGSTKGLTFGYVGTLGYYSDSAGFLYVRARYYRPNWGRWMTVDPVWPRQLAYGYVRCSPVILSDPSGLAVLPIICAGACILAGGCALGIWMACEHWDAEFDSFEECAWAFIDSLPWFSKVGCLAGLAGCIACLYRFVKGKLDCAALLAAYKLGCSSLDDIDQGKWTCTDSDNCTTLGLKLANFSRCAAARRLYRMKCVPKCNQDSGHDAAIIKQAGAASVCAALWAAKCSWWVHR